METEKENWKQFASSGKVEDYLRYANQRNGEHFTNHNREEETLDQEGSTEEIRCKNLLL